MLQDYSGMPRRMSFFIANENMETFSKRFRFHVNGQSVILLFEKTVILLRLEKSFLEKIITYVQ